MKWIELRDYTTNETIFVNLAHIECYGSEGRIVVIHMTSGHKFGVAQSMGDVWNAIDDATEEA